MVGTRAMVFPAARRVMARPCISFTDSRISIIDIKTCLSADYADFRRFSFLICVICEICGLNLPSVEGMLLRRKLSNLYLRYVAGDRLGHHRLDVRIFFYELGGILFAQAQDVVDHQHLPVT